MYRLFFIYFCVLFDIIIVLGLLKLGLEFHAVCGMMLCMFCMFYMMHLIVLYVGVAGVRLRNLVPPQLHIMGLCSLAL